jgi:hypothetical protein
VQIREETVFKWVVIIGAVVAFLVAVTLLTRPLVGAILLLVALLAATVYAFRWIRERRRSSS